MHLAADPDVASQVCIAVFAHHKDGRISAPIFLKSANLKVVDVRRRGK
jgi:hypothetical protein